MADIFVSYTSSDRDAAHWIAQELKVLGHTPHIHEWEIKGGDDIYAWMQERHDAADFVLCVVSDAYLKAPYSTLERNAALWQAAGKRPGFARLVVVKPCTLPTLSDHYRRCDLVGVPEDVARLRLREFLEGAKPERMGFFGQLVAVSNITIHVPQHFMGRDEDLAAVRATLARYEGRVVITALHGLRGVGKTVLAAAYAERYRRDYRATWWIRAQTEPTMRADLAALGVRLGWVDAEAKEEPAFDAVMDRLRHEGEGILLIYDNAADARSLTPYLPLGGAARVIVTSNDHAWRGVAEPVEIQIWPPAIGADYLIARTGRIAERDAAESLSRLLGGLPLAHEQAAAYCEELGVSLAEYARRFTATPAKLLDDDERAPVEYGLTVARSFTLAIEQAALRHPAAEALILHAALLPPEPIPLFLFAEGRMQLGEPLATLLADDGLDKAIRALRIFALVYRESIPDEREPGVVTESIRIHRLVREAVRLRLSKDEIVLSCSVLVRVIIPIFGKEGRLTSWVRARRLESLIADLVENVSDCSRSNQGDRIALLFSLTIFRLDSRASYSEAQKTLSEILEYQKSALGLGNEKTLQTMHALAFSTRGTGDMASAIALYKYVIDLRTSVLGPNHRDTLETMNHLGFCLHRVGDFDLSEDLIRNVISRQKRILGENHPDTLLALGNLAICLTEKGDIEEAEKLYRYVLAEQERVIGLHGLTLESIGNLAYCLMRRNNPDEAKKLFERMLDGAKRLFGPDHPTYRTAYEAFEEIASAQVTPEA